MNTIFHDFSAPMFAFHRTTHWEGSKEFHFHNHYELDVIKSGDMTLIANGTRIDHRGPCLLLYKPYSRHVNIYHPTDNYDIFVFHFAKSVAESFSQFVDVNDLYLRDITLIPLEDRLYDEVFSILGAFDEAPERETQRRLLLACLLEITKRNIGKSITEAIDEKYRYIHDAANYVTDHFGERLTSDSIAKQFLVSTRKLENDFKSVMSMTLRQYILDIRIANSIRLMSLGQKVAQVAYMCGFASETHFIHAFKGRMGISPYQYSKIVKSKEN